MSLYEYVEPRCSLESLFFNDKVLEQINQILDDHKYQDALLENGLPVRKKILLYGPPGCGKTSLAHGLAQALKMRLYEVSAAQMIDSHLGESAKNVENALKFAQANKVVMLLDEFDSIAGKRGAGIAASDKTYNGVVNALLTNMEGKPPLGLLVACTNLPDLIDPAFLRRFDFIIEIASPPEDVLKKIALSIIDGRFGISSADVLAEASTPAEVVRVAMDKLRRAVIKDEKRGRKKVKNQIPLWEDANDAQA